ncbi:MAG: peptidoglycan-binding protein [Planctomycetota bacterium]|jgi:peptidoglycan hydrolase-like protein with peptidoglycan-binding domain
MVDGIGGGNVYQAEQAGAPAPSSTNAANLAEQITPQVIDPAVTQQAWAAHQSDPAAVAVQGAAEANHVDYAPDVMTMDEFYETSEPFFKALDGALNRVLDVINAQKADAPAADSTQASGGVTCQPPEGTEGANSSAPVATQDAGGLPPEIVDLVRQLARELASANPDAAKIKSLGETIDSKFLDHVSGGDPELRAQIARQFGASQSGGGAVGGALPETSTRPTDGTKPAGYDSLDAARAGNYIRSGSSGPEVRAMQEALNASGIEPQLEVNGTCGPEMEAAIRTFQQQNGCAVDGIVGPETMGALDAKLGLPVQSGPRAFGGGGGNASYPVTGAAPVAPGEANRNGALQAATSQMGVREASGNNDGVPAQRYSNGRNVPWCANFVSWSFRQAGTPLPGNQVAIGSCDTMMNELKNQGSYFNRGQGTPQPGDVIFFGTPGDSTHVGIVESVTNGKVNTVEGNSGNRVTRRSYDLNASRIMGYGRP